MERVELFSPPGVRFLPDSTTGWGVLVLAGSSGRVDTARAETLARLGVVTESIQWFGGPGQQTGPWAVPIERFLARLGALRAECERVAIVGTSFGAEAALVAGSCPPVADLVAAFAPTDVVWGAQDDQGAARSHWTLDGVELPYVPFLPTWKPDSDPPAYRGLYEQSRAAARQAVQAASIPAERIPTVILVAGGDDQVWPAVPQAESITARRAGHDLSTVLVVDPEAGHRAVLPGEPVPQGGLPMARGGTQQADSRLGDRAWQVLRAALTSS